MFYLNLDEVVYPSHGTCTFPPTPPPDIIEWMDGAQAVTAARTDSEHGFH